MPAAVGSVSLALVAGVCVALTDTLDIAETLGDGGQDAGRYLLHEL